MNKVEKLLGLLKIHCGDESSVSYSELLEILFEVSEVVDFDVVGVVNQLDQLVVENGLFQNESEED